MGNPVGTTYEEELARRSKKAHVLDENHFFNFVTGSWSEGRYIGILVWHRASDGIRACGGHVAFERSPEEIANGKERPIWTVESWDPLTISPSVLCKGEYGDCGGTHGFIRNGMWVPA